MIAFVGDIMLHGKQIKSAFNSELQIYNFDSYFEKINKDFNSFDYLVGNLESPVAGKELGYGAYPLFNGPTEILESLRRAGFDMVQVANNHSYDRGYQGLKNTLANISKNNIQQVGYHSDISQPEATIVTIDEIQIALISVTYGFNIGANQKSTGDGILLTSQNEIIEQMIQKAQEQEVDSIIILPHWGSEYSRIESQEQVQLATRWIEAGASVVVGSHPHVVQPVREITSPNGNKGIVAYSLGNFVSNQQDIYTDLGALFIVSITKQEKNKKAVIDSYEVRYLFNHQNTERRPGYTDYTIHYLKNALDIEQRTEKQKARISQYLQTSAYQDFVVEMIE